MSTEFKMSGFDSHNLLAFLALIGMLKSLDEARPEWKSSISWIDFKPHLHTTDKVDSEQVINSILDGLKKISTTNGNDWTKKFKNLNIAYDEFVEMQCTAPSKIRASLGTDGAIQKGKVEYPPLCTMLGAGHQNFLERLKMAIDVSDDDKRSKANDDISKMLFDEWRYEDMSTITFRWDPNEYRPHAYRGKNPASEKYLTVNGANRLAAAGFTNYWCVPASSGLGTIACKKNRGGIWNIFWPIWSKKLSLDAIFVLMCHPHMKAIQNNRIDEKARTDLYNMGVYSVMSADIFWDEKFRNVTWAKPVI